jgi:hypothetical protein
VLFVEMIQGEEKQCKLANCNLLELMPKSPDFWQTRCQKPGIFINLIRIKKMEGIFQREGLFDFDGPAGFGVCKSHINQSGEGLIYVEAML